MPDGLTTRLPGQHRSDHQHHRIDAARHFGKELICGSTGDFCTLAAENLAKTTRISDNIH
jgi:hypothetical protein